MGKTNLKTIGHLVAFLTVFIWGTTFISTKLLLRSFSPLEVLIFRFVIGYICLLIIYPRFIKTKSFKEELLFILAGICGVTLYFLFENIALTYTLASNVGIITAIAPFFTAIMAHFFLKGESFKIQFFIGFSVAILGIILITFNGNYVLKLNPIGDILAVLACLFWALYSILMKKISTLNYHNIGCTRRVFFYGIVFMIPSTLFLDFNLDFSRFTNPINLINILFLGIGASALCFVTWNWCVKILGAVKTSTYIYLVPVITLASSYLVLNENITKIALIGAALTILGLIISEKKPKKKLDKV